MSRQNRAARGIRGPQSALTDFLASHNISANQIRLDAEARRRAAELDNPTPPTGEQLEAPAPAPAPAPAVLTGDRPTSYHRTNDGEGKRKNDKIKASKSFKKRKRNLDDSEDEDDLVQAIFKDRAVPLPGQMENCAECGKRFTVTPYSRNAPGGGLLCTPCGKELSKDASAPKKKPKRASAGAVGRNRQVQSEIMDGTYHPGAKDLMTMCITTLAKNIDLAEDLGELPPLVIDKIARKLSKLRLVDSRTLSLFLQPSNPEIYIYDGSRLTSDDFLRIFQAVPTLKKLKIRNAIHFKDEVMDYFLTRNIELNEFYLHGANLLSEAHWKRFLREKGKPLQSLRVYWTDKHFGDEVLAELEATCPSLERLKVSHNQKVTGEGIKSIAKVKSLRHVSLDLRNEVHSDVYVHLLSEVGANLETLSLSRVPDADNTVLDALHTHCRNLEKLRITDSEVMTDEGFARLFKGWENPGLKFVDFQKCRQLDSTQPRQNPNNVGLCSNGFRELMAHSRKTIRHLNVHACRHISAAAFEHVFSAGNVYPQLTNLEISFCEEVDDFIVGSIWRSCPNLRELNVFGCMKLRDVKVPWGKIVVGLPNAVGMVIEGKDDE